ncbi:hypothetical protein BGW38_008106 [Lunasporangiospora selenospora]|uniref:ML domain-containing protein n=1 Tax=Lunasporangiospora selenospora TaxID=979761 RepID=A0A9P6FXZ0_9FUNG|nr:hypothetical protein BGW38_008106 [Lunasporangiospora selenospora]
MKTVLASTLMIVANLVGVFAAAAHSGSPLTQCSEKSETTENSYFKNENVSVKLSDDNKSLDFWIKGEISKEFDPRTHIAAQIYPKDPGSSTGDFISLSWASFCSAVLSSPEKVGCGKQIDSVIHGSFQLNNYREKYVPTSGSEAYIKFDLTIDNESFYCGSGQVLVN